MERYVIEKSVAWTVIDTAKKVTLARCATEGVALTLLNALTLETKDTQLVAVPNETCTQMGQLMEYYADKGVCEVNRADVIKSSVNAIHKTVFNTKGEK